MGEAWFHDQVGCMDIFLAHFFPCCCHGVQVNCTNGEVIHIEGDIVVEGIKDGSQSCGFRPSLPF